MERKKPEEHSTGEHCEKENIRIEFAVAAKHCNKCWVYFTLLEFMWSMYQWAGLIRKISMKIYTEKTAGTGSVSDVVMPVQNQ